MTEKSPWTPPRVLLALFLWLACTLWLRPLALPDEGRYVGVAWEMLRSGDWRVPTLDGLPFFHKPPLFYWITAVSLQVFGVHPWSGRIAPLIGAMLAGGSLYGLLRRRVGEDQARAALLVLATSPFLFGGAQYANLDMLVAGCISATVCAAADAMCALELGQPHRRSLLLAWALAGLGVLAKGLIGIVLPGGVLLVWLVWRRRPKHILALLWWPGPLLMLLVTGPWFFAMQQRFPDFLHYFFIYQQFQRFAEGGFNNQQPFWFYVPATLLLVLPWSLGAWWALKRRGTVAGEGGDPLRLNLLMWVWMAVIVGFFSMPKSKLIGYVLPALPPLAAVLAAAWRAQVPRRRFNAVALLSAALSLSFIVAVTVFDKKSAAPLVPALQAQRQPGEPLLIVGRYTYDLPLLLKEPAPVAAVTDWHDTVALKRDSWQKELFDAGEFDPAAARRVLIDQRDLRTQLCRQAVTWVVVSEVKRPPELATASLIARTRYLELLRLDLSAPAARAALCGGTPTSG